MKISRHRKTLAKSVLSVTHTQPFSAPQLLLQSPSTQYKTIWNTFYKWSMQLNRYYPVEGSLCKLHSYSTEATTVSDICKHLLKNFFMEKSYKPHNKKSNPLLLLAKACYSKTTLFGLIVLLNQYRWFYCYSSSIFPDFDDENLLSLWICRRMWCSWRSSGKSPTCSVLNKTAPRGSIAS